MKTLSLKLPTEGAVAQQKLQVPLSHFPIGQVVPSHSSLQIHFLSNLKLNFFQFLA